MRGTVFVLLSLAVRLALGAALSGSPSPQIDAQTARVIRESREAGKTDAAAAETVLRDYLAGKRAPAVLYELGRLRASAGDAEEAITLFREVVELDPAFPSAEKNLGQLLSAAGRHEEAVRRLRRALGREGYDPACCAALGRSLLYLGRFVEAEEPLRYALMAGDDEGQVTLALAHALFGQKRYADCDAAAARVAARDTKAVSAWLLMANARIADGRTGDAADALEAARLLGVPLDTNALWTLGDL